MTMYPDDNKQTCQEIYFVSRNKHTLETNSTKTLTNSIEHNTNMKLLEIIKNPNKEELTMEI